MKKHLWMLLASVSLSGVHAFDGLQDEEIMTFAAEEEILVLQAESDDRFVDVVNLLQKDNYSDEPKVMNLEVQVYDGQVFVKSSKGIINRNYDTPVSSHEKKDLLYIVNTLARNSLMSIASDKGSLKKAGDRINHLHPLRFLMTIFTDEEMKADISAIRSRGWVWSSFYDGLEGSLKEESKKGNIKTEFVMNFAQIIGINPDKILPAIQDKRWKDFVNILIDTVPRTGNPNRYDM